MRRARAGTPRRRGGMSCSRPAATMRKPRNTSATASIAGRFRSSSATRSRARPACRPTATCSPARRPGVQPGAEPVAPARGHPERRPRRHVPRRRHPAAPADVHRELSCKVTGRSTAARPAASPRRLGPIAARLALYPFDAPAADLRDPAKAVATARVDDVLPASSRLVIEGKAQLDPKETYKAVIVSLPTPPLCVLLEGDAAACALVRRRRDDRLARRKALALRPRGGER